MLRRFTSSTTSTALGTLAASTKVVVVRNQSSSSSKDAAMDQLMSAFKKKERSFQQQQQQQQQQTKNNHNRNTPTSQHQQQQQPNRTVSKQPQQKQQPQQKPQVQQNHQASSSTTTTPTTTPIMDHKTQQKVKNLERKLSQMTNDEFGSRHLDSLMRSNIGKLPHWMIHVTLNEAEKRIAVLGAKAVRDTLLLSASSRHGDRQSLLQQQQQQQNNNVNNSASSSSSLSSSSSSFTSRCVSIFLQRAKTHSRDPTFGLLDAVVDAAYHNESFEELIALSSFAADKLVQIPEDHPTDIALFRCLWRVVCLGVKKNNAVRHETKMVSKNYLSMNNTNTNNIQMETKNVADDIEQHEDPAVVLKMKLKQLHQQQNQIEQQWRSAAEEIWKHMMRCNPQLQQQSHNQDATSSSTSFSYATQQERSQLFTSLHRFVLYGSSKHQHYLHNNQNQQKDDFSSNNSDSSPSSSGQLLDWGEMHSYHLWYERKLFLCSKTQPLQLYVSLVRTCRPGLWLEQSQLYFESYQASLVKNNNNNNNDEVDSASPNNNKNSGGGVEEILIFTLISVFQHGKDYKRICSLGKNLIQSAGGVSVSILTENNNNDDDEHQNQNNNISSPLVVLPVDAISASVLASVAQAAGETHDSLLVNQCLTLILRKFIRAAHFSGNDKFQQHQDHPFPSTFTLYQALSAAAKSGASGFPQLADSCIQNGWVTVEESPSSMAQQQQVSKTNTNAQNLSNNNNNSGNVNDENEDDDMMQNLPQKRQNTSTDMFEPDEDEDDELMMTTMMMRDQTQNKEEKSGNNNNNNNNNNKNSKKQGMKNNKQQSTTDSTSINSSLFDAEKDVRLHLLLQWANACSNVHQEGHNLISKLEAEIKSVKKKALEDFEGPESHHHDELGMMTHNKNNNNKNNSLYNNNKTRDNKEEKQFVNSAISSILSERCHNQVLQLLHRIEHQEYLKWYRLGRNLGYFRQQWIEMLVLWADRRRYSLRDEERRYVLSEFRSSGVSESGLRPMLALLKFDFEERPLERFKKEFAAAHDKQNHHRHHCLPPRQPLPAAFIDSNPSVLDPRVHFLRRGSSKVTDLGKNFVSSSSSSSSSVMKAPRPVTTCDKSVVPLFVSSSSNSSSQGQQSSSTFYGPPTLYPTFFSAGEKKSTTIRKNTNNTNNNNKNEEDEITSALLLQWFLCNTVEGMQVFGNGFGIEDHGGVVVSGNDGSDNNNNDADDSSSNIVIPYKRLVEKAEKRLLSQRR